MVLAPDRYIYSVVLYGFSIKMFTWLKDGRQESESKRYEVVTF